MVITSIISPKFTLFIKSILLIVRQNFCLLFIFCWLGYHVLPAQQFDVQNYGVSDGLAQSQVYALIADSRGYLWMGTQGGGLCRFANEKFDIFSASNPNGIPNNYIQALYEDRAGILWIGTQNGLCSYDGFRFTQYPLLAGQSLTIWCIFQDHAGNMWIGTNGGVFCRKDSSFLRLESVGYGTVTAIFEDHKNRIWIGQRKGLGYMEEDVFHFLNRSRGIPSLEITDIAEDSLGTLWVATYAGGVYRQEGDGFQPVFQETPLKGGLVFDLMFDRKGILWVATQNQGVARWDGLDSSLVFLTADGGLASNHVRCLLEDDWGILWMGSSGGGLGKYAGQQFVHYSRNQGLRRQVYAVQEDNDCNMWLGNAAQGLAVLSPQGEVSYHDASNGFLNRKVKCLEKDRQGRMWIGTDGGGIALWADSVFHFFTGSDGLGGNWIRDILAIDTSIYVATAGGGITQIIPQADDSTGLQFDFSRLRYMQDWPRRINCLHLDKKQRLWFGTVEKGIGYMADSTVFWVKGKGGKQQAHVRSMVEDDAGNLWIGTAGGGVNRLTLYPDADTFPLINFRESLTSGNIYSLQLDPYQNLWIGTERGLDHATMNEERDIIEIKHYGKDEGFEGVETCQNATFQDREGRLWTGTVEGLTRFDPSFRPKNDVPPQFSIRQIDLFYQPMHQTRFGSWIGSWGKLRNGLKLPYDQNHLGFEFIGINPRNAAQVKYQWRLLGAEQTWSPPSPRNSATYSNLSPGEYRFQAKAANEDGVWSEPLSTPAFEILPPFWQRWWFIAAAITLGVLTIISFFLSRIRQIQRKAAAERQRLELDMHMLELEQKALRLQMNPHFIFNALNSIQSLIARHDSKTARYFLAKFSKLMRLVLENSREARIPLDLEVQTLDNYLALECFSRGESFTYELVIDEEIDPEVAVIPPMLIQPFVENAIIHGVAHRTEGGNISVNFTVKDDFLVCAVTDNGLGRKHAQSLKSQQGHQHKSAALIVTQERLAGMQNLDVADALKIIDLVAPDGSPLGTQVQLTIPYEE